MSSTTKAEGTHPGSNLSTVDSLAPRSVAYEPPVLVPLGNLRDLLAAGGTANCDGTEVIPGGGLDDSCV